MTAYYNEVDPFAAQWLRNLISAGCIAPGDVDERDIRDVTPRDLSGYTQCHFFGGIGVWSYALRQAGWADDEPVWTGSCPCQPFSAAGARGGVADERHLWPHWHHLIRECRPAKVFGEQVASADGLAWLDLVCSDMEAEGYAIGAADLCAAGSASHISQSLVGRSLVEQARWVWLNETDPARKTVWGEFADYLGSLVVGAPHIRQRLYFVGLADSPSQRRRETRPMLDRSAQRSDSGDTVCSMANADDARSQGRGERRDGAEQRAVGSGVLARRLADAHIGQRGRLATSQGGERNRTARGRHESDGEFERCGANDWLEHASIDGRLEPSGRGTTGRCGDGRMGYPSDATGERDTRTVSGTQAGVDGAWRTVDGGEFVGPEHAGAGVGARQPCPPVPWCDADWLFCRDGKWRPVEPRPQQMADGSTEGLGQLRPGHIEDIELEVAEWSIKYKIDAGKALLDLWVSLSEKAKREWPIRGLPDFYEAPILLSFMRQLSVQGWAFSESVSCEGEKTTQDCLRMLWCDEETARPSCERGLDGQPAREFTDPMCVLSSILARHAQEAWGKAVQTYADTGLPLANAASRRVGRLRAYGNAICPQTATQFIEAVMG